MTPLMLIVLFAGLCAAAPKDVGRIVGGDEISIEQYPFMVQIEALRFGRWGQSCAGNIVNEWFILTAAHCTSRLTDIFFRLENRRIRAGATYREEGGLITNAAAVLNHPTFSPIFNLNIDGDISLIRVETPYSWNDAIRSIAIPPQDYAVADNLPVIHAGWGRVVTGGDPSPKLLHITINTVNHKECRDRYANAENPLQRGVVTENMICAGLLDVGGRGACQGDSGGPLYYGNVLIGIISWGGDCADPNLPTVSAKVSSYTGWIVYHANF